MTKTLEAVVRRRWLPAKYAVREVVAFERRFGKKHLALACQAALPLILTPELVNLIRINFLDSEDIPWIAESDFLLSPLCRPIQEGIYEVEPTIREVLLVELEDKFGWRIPFELAEFLEFYLGKQPDWKQRPELTRTQKWIAQAYLDPDSTVREIKDRLEESLPEDNPILGLPDQSYIPHLVEILAEPLERTNLWNEHQYLVNSTRALSKLLSGEREELREEIREVSGAELGDGDFVLMSPVIEQFLPKAKTKSEVVNEDKEKSIPYPQWMNYLESVRYEYNRWWNFYTSTDAVEQQLSEKEELTSPLDFVQKLQTRSANKTEEKIERLPVIEGIRKYAPQHVLLLGKPGSGKSTALARLLLEEAERAISNLNSDLNQDQVKIPVLVELRYYRTSLLDLIRDWFKRHRLLLSLSEIETLLFQNRFLLLIDGLNEVPSSEAIKYLKSFRLKYQATPMIFTTRELDSGENMGIDKLLVMQSLTEAQSHNFVRSYLLEQGEQLWRQLGQRLREFGQTPLLLWMLCELFRQRKEIPSNLGLIFRQFTQGYENHLQEDVPVESDRRQWRYLLQHLAFMMMQGKEPTEFRVAIPKQEAKAILRQFWQGKVAVPDSLAIKYLDDLLKYHLIQIGSSEQIEFRSQLLQEYYTAESLLLQLPSFSDEQLKKEYLNHEKWTEPIVIMMSLLENEPQLRRVINLALEVDYHLGIRLVGEIGSERAVPVLIQVLKDEDSEVRRRATSALGEIGSEQAVSSLLQVLQDEDSADFSH